MSKTPIHQDGSGSADDQPRDPNQDPSAEVDTEDRNDAQSAEYVNPRDRIMEDMARRNDEERRIQAGQRQEDMPFGEPAEAEEQDPGEEGLQYREAAEGDEPEGRENLPDEYADDPLADFIVMEGDEPMMRTVVNGQQKLIPLEKARAQLQKNLAADQRLQEANQIHQSLEERARAIEAREAEIQKRLEQMHEKPTQPSLEDAGLTDEQLTSKAQAVIKDLFTGSEDEAAASLAKLLLETRGAAQVATNTVDPEEIAARAVQVARQQISAEEREKDVKSGYKKFTDDYPEIAEDDNLFRLADSMTGEIEREHPDWMPSEVMLEAGKRVREWVKSQRGETSEPSNQPDNDRKARKRNLRPMPRARQGVEPTPRGEDQTPETPADVLRQIKESRGQVA